MGYRYYAQHTAAALDITGFVRNLPGGNVEVVAEGDHDAVNKLVHLLKEGPSFAFVEGVDIEEIPAEGKFTHFTIKF